MIILNTVVLLNKSDCDGLYSPGNSLDIIKLIENIKIFVINEDVLIFIE